MTSRTVLTMSNHKHIDLLAPTAAEIDFEVIAEHLSKVNRFNGATKGLSYNVAEHSVRCADAAIAETGDARLAAYLLIHDGHETYLGDDTTPKKRALASIIEACGVLRGALEKAFNELTDRFDVAIHQAAGLDWPPPPEVQSAIHHFDRVLLVTEWRDLMRCEPPYDFAALPIARPLHGLHWRQSRDEFLYRAHVLLPALKEKAA